MLSRRDFIKQASLLSGGLGVFSALPPAIAKALSIAPAPGSTFLDAEHVVILMQENRSFDHSFGALRGVRGFDDPRAITIPGGNPVWLQTDDKGDTYAPFGMRIHDSKSTWMDCLPHDRDSQVAACNNGKMDMWLQEKQSGIEAYSEMPLTLGYYDRNDIPFYYAFADAFTICDQHYSSAQTCTSPNRLFHWSGTCRDPRNTEAVALLNNSQIDYGTGANWTTFPERLEDAGVSWKVYQNEIDQPSGLTSEAKDWLGNFGDNALEYFPQYQVGYHQARMPFLKERQAALRKKIEELEELKNHTETPDEQAREQASLRKQIEKIDLQLERWSPENFAKQPERLRALHTKAFTTNTGDPDYRTLAALTYQDADTSREVRVPKGDVFHQFRADVNQGRLPTVSWLVAPRNFSDHPSTPWYGAWYVAEVLDILTKNPELWKKTIFILTYDENDGFYDHVPPFAPPHPAKPTSGAASAAIDTALEFDEDGHSIGLGYRVPMVIASPWSRGGKVCSQVFDHTSVLQFLETFLSHKTGTPVREPNISTWRRTICGDLTSAFAAFDAGKETNPAAVGRDEFVKSIHRAKFKRPPATYKRFSTEEINEIRAHPLTHSLLPQQESGQRPSCPLCYELHAEGRLNRESGSFEITFEAANQRFANKALGAPFQVYAPGKYLEGAASVNDAAPPFEEARRWSFAMAAGDKLAYQWPLGDFAHGRYHLRTYGPNGFFREYAGDGTDPQLEIACRYAGDQLAFTVANRDAGRSVRITLLDDAYGKPPVLRDIAPGATETISLDLTSSHRWYSLRVTVDGFPQFSRHYAGRVETGEPGMSDPLIGRKRS